MQKSMMDFETVIKAVFEDDYDKAMEASDFRELWFWDSLKYLQLVMHIQSTFQIELSQDEIQEMTSISALKKILKSHSIEV